MPVAVTPLLASAWRRGLDLLFPPRCADCGGFGAFLCPDCLAATPRARPPRCPVCWMPGSGDVCERCHRNSFAFEAARCPFVYAGAAREAVHALKYRGVSAIAPVMAEAMAECLVEWPPERVSALVPVPLAGRRRRSRGYNQSEALARELSRLRGLPVVDGLLVRRKTAPPQAHAADEATRHANVADAFAVGRKASVGGAILLVDDVMTSGATLDASARALRAAGHEPVYALTFARED
ncbi:MAG: ComF family protein [Chloroflexi bacterium]|nr:ComF family protein [Chloroflexota bacterium]